MNQNRVFKKAMVGILSGVLILGAPVSAFAMQEKTEETRTEETVVETVPEVAAVEEAEDVRTFDIINEIETYVSMYEEEDQETEALEEIMESEDWEKRTDSVERTYSRMTDEEKMELDSEISAILNNIPEKDRQTVGEYIVALMIKINGNEE